ncbi:MAG: hypothetical protein CBB68_13100 [Rhodospirillaceae bacterium TMED8]|nr:ABC transporter [Magnetovibrio sp.]OUT49040.1 MAG: hypothetical protein CBB68_13100 [Rhodospirillaceae bacterium TMED8]|tara:strand:- start:1595 stop:3496 length:1902 start_codon:yes stop_codon:yes gene_type:complete
MTPKSFSFISRKNSLLAAIGLSLVLFLAVNIFSNNAFRALQLDLTEGSLFTLSDGTRKVLMKVEEPIVVRLYFSPILGEQSPTHARYYERVRELLEQYANLTKGRFQLKLLNPEPFSDHEDSAVSFGLTGVPINDAGDLGYFGLAASNSTDDTQIVPFFSPEREAFLEYDLTKLTLALASVKKTVVGVMSTLPINGGFLRGSGNRPRWTVVEQINDFFEVQPIAPDTPVIENDISVLMVVHPKDLSKQTQYAIDQFVMKGGKVLAFVDPVAEVDGPGGSLGKAGASEFDYLLKSWGVELRKGRVAGDLDTARRVNVRVGAQLTIADYVGWLSLRPGNFDRKDPVMGNLKLLNVGTAGILDKIKDGKTSITPLIRTGMRSMPISASEFSRQPDVIGLFRKFKPSGEQLTLAARITGPASSAFPEGLPDATANKSASTEHVRQSRGNIQVIVVADVDMLHDQLWVNVQDLLGRRLPVPFANNADFVVGALENLTGGASLGELRGRTISSRPFHLVRNIRQAAEIRFRVKEEELQKELDSVRGELSKLIRRENIQSGEVILKLEDRGKINKARLQMVRLRTELRDVQHELRKDIDRLDSWLKFFNIAAIPMVLALGTLIFAFTRRFRRRGGTVETS